MTSTVVPSALSHTRCSGCVRPFPTKPTYSVAMTRSSIDALRGDRRCVDLDGGERQAVEIAERRVAGAEIVKGQPHALSVQLEEVRQQGVVVAPEDRFRNLQLQLPGRQPGNHQAVHDHGE